MCRKCLQHFYEQYPYASAIFILAFEDIAKPSDSHMYVNQRPMLNPNPIRSRPPLIAAKRLPADFLFGMRLIVKYQPTTHQRRIVRCGIRKGVSTHTLTHTQRRTEPAQPTQRGR